MYKLIAIDLDGTLFDSYGQVSNENKEAIRYAINKGINVVLASGREPQSIKKTSLSLGIKDFLIAGNGASVYSIKEDKNIYQNYINKVKALEIIKKCKENSMFVNIYTNRGIIAEKLEYNVKVFNSENNYKSLEKRTNIEIVSDIYKYIVINRENNYKSLEKRTNIEIDRDIYKYIDEHEMDILKIIICDNNKIIFNNIVQKLKNISGINVLDVEHMSKKKIKIETEVIEIEYFYTEITNKNTDKWEAILFLIKRLNIKEEDVICIGDNINDKKMIENAGLGISMKDSALALLSIGDYITESNDSSGVAKAIYKYIE